ncbi:peptide-binding protein [Desulfovibrio litoralis]|uniref:Peptide/nickel transport system substrate-binding protein n=1 Tax=Desulfovibrio litoralis DSM 11393 TaxID=1121455 RepID=A0A1M7T5Z6_9BACT|nr:peptide-binding protein [Desulfovibrio litoralis]SHN66127.1 peptide/nickel transport system substrate-binding protein [Desulfovibrio litoralis DSM 11393]
MIKQESIYNIYKKHDISFSQKNNIDNIKVKVRSSFFYLRKHIKYIYTHIKNIELNIKLFAVLCLFFSLFFYHATLKAQSQPEFGDQIILSIAGEPSNLLPFIAQDAPSHEVASLLFISLLKYDKDLKIVPSAAESFEVLEDGKLLRFKIKEGIKWEDGVEFTADDVEFTYNIMVDPQTATAYAEDFLVIKDFKKTGKYTFEVRYDQVFARSLITWMSSMMPKHLLETKEHALKVSELDEKQAAARAQILANKYASFGRKPKGNGAYALTKWEAGSNLTLKSNPLFFEGRTYLDGVTYRVIPDPSTMFLELKAKKIDMMNLTPLQKLHQTNTKEWEKNYKKFEYLSFGYTFMGYNLNNPLFNDKKVRQAITTAIDKNHLLAGVLLAQGLPTIGPYKPGTWVYNDQIKDYSYDPDLALKLLGEAGWKDSNKDGILDKDGKNFSFTLLLSQGNEQRTKAAIIIQHQLKKVGIEVKIRTVEWAAFIKEFVNKGNFDAVILGWNILQDPDLFDVWHSSRAKPGGLNFINYKNPEVDKLLEEGRSTLDQEKRKVIYDRFQEILHEDQPYCFLFVPYSLPIIDARFQDIKPSPAGLTHNFERWWVPKNLQRYTIQP